MTSTWTQSHPARSMARTSSPRRAKSADRIDGAIRVCRVVAIVQLPLDTSGPRSARPGLFLKEVVVGARPRDAACCFASLDSRRRIDLKTAGSAVGLQEIDTADVEAESFGRAQCRLTLLVTERGGLGFASTMQV